VVRSIMTGDGHTEYTPIGHTTNLASRMQTAAPVGSIAISEATRKLCEGYFILKPLGATKFKGISEPVNVYEVTGLGPLRTRLQRAVGRGLTKFVGREREMEALKHAAEQAKGGRGQIVAAMAEPGVGKSRLFFEFKATSQSGWMVLAGFSVSHRKASAYFPVIGLLHSYFKITGDDDLKTRCEKVTDRVLESKGLHPDIVSLTSKTHPSVAISLPLGGQGSRAPRRGPKHAERNARQSIELRNFAGVFHMSSPFLAGSRPSLGQDNLVRRTRPRRRGGETEREGWWVDLSFAFWDCPCQVAPSSSCQSPDRRCASLILL
jgi:hypothetical protein